MALKLTVDKIEELEEPQRALYIEKDGKFHLDVDGIEDPSPLKKTIQKLNSEMAARRKALEPWEKLGKTPDEILELLAAKEEEKTKEAESKGDWDKLRQQMNDKHAADLKKIQDQLGAKDNDIRTLRTKLEDHIVEAAAITAITSNKGEPLLLLPIVKRFIKVVEEDGQLGIQVVDEKGEARVNGKGDPLTLGELVSEMRGSEIFGRAFDGTGSSGGGSKPSNGGPPTHVTRRADLKTERERAAYIDKYGLAAYEALPFM